MSIIVGRYIGGISLNGLEYLLCGNGKPKEFEDVQSAKQFLLDTDYPGVSDEKLEDLFIFEEVQDGKVSLFNK